MQRGSKMNDHSRSGERAALGRSAGPSLCLKDIPKWCSRSACREPSRTRACRRTRPWVSPSRSPSQLGQGPQPEPKAGATAKPADPKAKALLDEVSRAYKALGSYSDQGQFVVAMTIAGKEQKQVMPMKLTFVRPNKLDLDAGPVRVVSDGKTLTTAIIPLKRYTTASAPEAISFETFREGPTGAVLFGGPAGPPMYVLLNLLTAPDAAAALAQLGGSLQLAPEDPKAPAPSILIDQTDGPDIRLNVDPSTKLLSGHRLSDRPQDPGTEAPDGQEDHRRAVRLDGGLRQDAGCQGPVFRIRASQGLFQG